MALIISSHASTAINCLLNELLNGTIKLLNITVWIEHVLLHVIIGEGWNSKEVMNVKVNWISCSCLSECFKTGTENANILEAIELAILKHVEGFLFGIDY